MVKLENREALEKLRNSLQAISQKSQKLISLCAGSGCGAYGTAKVHTVLQEELAKHNLQDTVQVKLTGCHGFCEKGPIMVIHPEGIFYPQVTPEKVPDIVKTTLIGQQLVDKLVYKDPVTKKKISHEEEIPFYKLQKRVIFGNVGNKHVEELSDITPREFLILSLLAACALGMGLYPYPFTEVMHSSVNELLRHVATSKIL